MPPRRRQAGKSKKKKKITTRLMEISLKLDDYVYKQKPISSAEARAHIQEILVYKAQCLKDERSLQVIEKLTRCMNAILAEEENSGFITYPENSNGCKKQDTSYTKTTAYYCPSPTYSMTDDNEQLLMNEQTQDNMEVNEKLLDSKQTQSTNIELTNSVATNQGCLIKEQTQENMRTKAVGTNNTEKVIIDTIDLCAEDEDRDHTFNIDVEMHRALSNLSIRDMQEDFNTVEVFSQSILDNVTQEISKPDLIKTKCSKSEITLIVDKNNKNNSNIIDLTENEKPCKNTEVKKLVRFEINNKESNTIAVSKKQSKSTPKKTTQKRNNNSKRGLSKQTNVEAKNKSKEQVNKRKKAEKQNTVIVDDKSVSILKTNTNINVAKPTSLVSTSIDLPCTAKTTLSGNNHNKMLISNVQKAKKNSISKIYSNNTENDMSWVENIRFVREIQKEEVDIKLSGLNESFWEDLSFPCDWDDREFEVN